jgi:hypothetical protein
MSQNWRMNAHSAGAAEKKIIIPSPEETLLVQ